MTVEIQFLDYGTGPDTPTGDNAPSGGAKIDSNFTSIKTAVEAMETGKADLVGGVVPNAQLPALAISEYLGTVDLTAMLALTGEEGDWCIRSDLGSVWIIIGDPAVIGGWQELSYPAAPVASVNGKVGVVVLVPADIGAATAAQGAKADTASQPDVAQEFTKQQNFNETSLVDAANIAWNLNDNQVTEVTLADNRTLDNPTNMKAGGTYVLRVAQDATGSRTLAFGPAYKWEGGTAPTLSTDANAVDILTFISDGVSMFGMIAKDFS